MKEAITSNFFDYCSVYRPQDISNEFKNEFKEILELKRGCGYWIWKFYFLKKYLDEVNEGDIIIYCDAGCRINKLGLIEFNNYINLLNNSEEGCISFAMDNNKENVWTIKELYDYFNFDINDIEINKNQYLASVLIFKKCIKSLLIIDECIKLLHYNKFLITDIYNNIQNREEFIENRHDQSILSLVRKKYGSIILGENVECKRNFPFWVTRIRR